MCTTTLIRNPIIQTLNVGLTIRFRSIEIESIAMASTRWNEITQTFPHIIIREIMTWKEKDKEMC